jgi:ketosteroid isomerase-like protein
MSQENVDFMRQAFQTFADGDLTALAGLLHPEVDWRAVEDPAPRTAFEGVLESLAAWFEVWEEVHVDLEELVDGGSSVIAVVNMRGRHPGSASEVSERFFQVWTMRNEQIVAFREYKTRTEALEAEGLSQQDAHAGS